MKIAKSLANLHQSKLVQATLDRSNDLDKIVDEVFSSLWTPDLINRNPCFEYVQGEDGKRYKETSFDLLPLLLNFSLRSAFVNQKYYNNLRPSTKKSNELVISKENRHGPVLQVNAHKESHAFSILIKDFNVVQMPSNGFERVGAPRRFTIIDDAGNWYEGFKGLEFIANLTENELFNRQKLLDKDGSINFKYFVHPARAMAIYSAGYLITKLVEERRADEAKFYRDLAKQLEEKEGISLPEIEEDPSWKFYFKKNRRMAKFIPKKIFMKKSEVSEKYPGETDVAAVLLADLEHPEFKGEYKIYGLNSGRKLLPFNRFDFDNLPRNKNALLDILRYCKARDNYLTHNIGTQLRTGTRAAELAFLKFGTNLETLQWGEEDNKPGWAVPDWQDIKIKNTDYRMLDFGNGFKLLYKLKVKTSQVAKTDTE